jgi:transposase
LRLFYVLRAGIQWKALPKEFGAASAVHRHFRFWREQGFFKAPWSADLAAYDEAGGIRRSCPSAGGCMAKAPLAREAAGRNPTDRGK